MNTNKPSIGHQFNARNYGCTGDGSTDDYAAITALVALAKVAGTTRVGAEIYFPPGNYKISSPIVLPRTGSTPTNVVHLVGDNVRTTQITGSASFPASHALIEWAASTNITWFQRIANLQLALPSVAGTKAIWHQANQATINATTCVSEWLQMDLENIEIQAHNDYHQNLIDLEIGCRFSSWRSVYGNPVLGSGTYATRLIRSRYAYTALSATATNSTTTATVTVAAGHGLTVGLKSWVTVAGADQTAYNGDWYVTVTSSTQYTYTMASDPGSGATGSLTSQSHPYEGEDSVGLGFCHLSNVHPMIITGGWCSAFEGRMYGCKWDVGFCNGAKTEHAAVSYHFLNEWANNLSCLQTEGNADTSFKFTRGQGGNVDNLYAPVPRSNLSAWAANHAYIVGDKVISTPMSTGSTPATANLYFTCSTAGTSHATTEPTWPTTAGLTASDNTAVWTATGAAVGSSVKLVACSGKRFKGHTRGRANVPHSYRATYDVVADSDSYDNVFENWSLRTIVSSTVDGSDTAANEVSLPSSDNRNHLSGHAVQAFGDYRLPYQLGSHPHRPSRTATLDFGSINAAASASLTVTVAGAVSGDDVHATPPSNLNDGMLYRAWVSSNNTVTVRLYNATSGAIDPASGVWRVTVLKP